MPQQQQKDSFVEDSFAKDSFQPDTPVLPIPPRPGVSGEGLYSSDSRRLERTPDSQALEAAHFGQNVLGMGQAAGRVVTTAGQWVQDLPRQARELSQEEGLGNKLKYVLGLKNGNEPSRLTPTPAWLQSTTPGQK